MNKVSFVIPCYRSEKTIAAVVEEIHDTMRDLTKYEYMILILILVNI